MNAARAQERRLRLGLCGAGWVVRNCYQPALARLGDLFDVAAVFDPDPEALNYAARAWPSARPCRSLAALISQRPDAAIVASPNAHHLDHASALLGAGISCLVEKPVVRGIADFARLNAATRQGARLVSGVACRFRQDTSLWLDHVAQLGPLTRLDLVWLRENGVPAAPWHRARDGGWTGVLADLGYHLLDIAAVALRRQPGRPQIVEVMHSSRGCHAAASWYAHGSVAVAQAIAYDTDDRFSATLLIAGCRVTLNVAWVDDEPGDIVRLAARGEPGEAVLSGLFGFSANRRQTAQRVVLRQNGEEIITDFEPGPDLQRDAFVGLLRHFHRRVCGEPGRDDDALRATAILAEAIREAVA